MTKIVKETLKEHQQKIQNNQRLAQGWGDSPLPVSNFDDIMVDGLITGRRHKTMAVTLQGKHQIELPAGRNALLCHGQGEIYVLSASGRQVVEFGHHRLSIDQLRRLARTNATAREILSAVRQVLPKSPRLPRFQR